MHSAPSSSGEESELETHSTNTSTKHEPAQTEENNDSDTENNNGFTVVTRKKRVPTTVINETKIEALKKNTMPAQCHRCQEFYHHRQFCNRTPKCLKYAGSLTTRDCPKTMQMPAKEFASKFVYSQVT
ncbi:hypothetical protein NPIL_503931 [Nephila pilipes]|uniref:Uncharacterized protein n=1 Tax=Nephila pilipes TaxID=299642 RepID=A0A8X6QY94_NEPPI|nr:hypothetical protein NPIL_503931 [Nephila pilipes]